MVYGAVLEPMADRPTNKSCTGLMGAGSKYETHGGYSMIFDPQKFFIGQMGFFSILLPGALLTSGWMGQPGTAYVLLRIGPTESSRGFAN